MFWLLIPTAISLVARLLFSIWNKLPTDVKLLIIETVVSSFIELFKEFYRNHKHEN